ncbi:hypothetical protein DdX_18429 [Ditylenchus destructor]|uniref:Uncharacterized protein n=1 Tax=Ditylenchus destructor TaxID=166010 RepID=A0AAD4MPK1_9BILA|nr:hypothetical protein DdX_18429 [Ditylenchus destructor]
MYSVSLWFQSSQNEDPLCPHIPRLSRFHQPTTAERSQLRQWREQFRRGQVPQGRSTQSDDWDSLPDEELVSGTPATRPSGATKKYRQNLYHCDLTDGIRNISVVLDDEQKGRLKDCVRKIEHFLQHSFGLSDDKRAAKAAHKLKQCLKKHNDIAKLIRFEKITTWGSIFDVTYVSVDLTAVYVDVIITLDSNDDCDLFEAMRNATEGDAEKESAVLVLIEELKVILLDVSLSMGQKKAKMHDKFKMFFEMHVEWEEFFLEIEIEGFGSLSEFVDVARGFKQSLTLEVVLSGSSDSDCALCEALTEASANTSFDLSVRSQIKQFRDKLVTFFATTTDVEVRLAYVSAQYWQMIIMEPWIVKVMSLVSIKDKTCGCGEDWGIFADLIWVSQFCKNSGSCGCVTCGMNPASTAAPSTTPVPTTQATTIAPAVCPNRPQLIVVSAQNKTILTDVLTEHYNSWNASMKLGFNTCFNQVRKAIWDNVQFPSASVKITEIVRVFKAYNANNLDKQKVLMDIYIAKWNGIIQKFCDCGSG